MKIGLVIETNCYKMEKWKLIFFLFFMFILGFALGVCISFSVGVKVAVKMADQFLDITLSQGGIDFINNHGYKLQQYIR